MQRAAGSHDPTALVQPISVLDGAADRAEDLADLAAQEDEGDDRNDGDQGEDQCVLGKTLAVLVPTEESDESVKHEGWFLLSVKAPQRGLEAVATLRFVP